MDKRWFAHGTALCLAATLLAACAAAAPGGSKAGGALAAWIDAPLDGAVLKMEAYPVVIHGTDPGGVAQLELSIEGTVVLTAPNANSASLLAKATHEWLPPAPGTYTLRARAQNKGGAWSDYAEATVTVLPDETPTPTFTPTPESRDGTFGEPEFSPAILSWAKGCPSDTLTASITAADPDGIKAVVLFYRLQNASTNALTAWANLAMNPKGGDRYSVSFKPGGLVPSQECALGEICSDDRAFVVQVQFVIQDLLKNMTRSQVYAPATLQKCLR